LKIEESQKISINAYLKSVVSTRLRFTALIIQLNTHTKQSIDINFTKGASTSLRIGYTILQGSVKIVK